MGKKFQVDADQAEFWVSSQRLQYASTSTGADGYPVRLSYLVGSREWAVERYRVREYALRTRSVVQAVDFFNELI